MVLYYRDDLESKRKVEGFVGTTGISIHGRGSDVGTVRRKSGKRG